MTFIVHEIECCLPGTQHASFRRNQMIRSMPPHRRLGARKSFLFLLTLSLTLVALLSIIRGRAFSPMSLGNYADTSVQLGANTTVTPDAAPTTVVAHQKTRQRDIRPNSLQANGKIAFHSNRDGVFQIYVMNLDGTGQTNLTNNPNFDGEPRWQ